MAYDDILKYLGEFGRYQKRIYFFLCLPAIFCVTHKLANVFLQAKTKHRCRLPYEMDNSTYVMAPEVINMTIPWDTAAKTWSSCQRLDANFTQEYFDAGIPTNNTVDCESWIYDTTTYKSSAVMEFNLVCEYAWLSATADALFMVGVLLGSIIFGDLSDRFGRRPIFFLSLVLQVIGGIGAAVLPNYSSFVAARMLIGATTSGVFLVAYVIAMEMVGPSKRMVAGVLCQVFGTIGYLLTAFFAYFIKEWRILQIAFSVPGVLFLSYWWFIPESVRWLLTKGKTDEAKHLILKVAKENKADVPDDVLDKLLEEERIQARTAAAVQKPSLLDLMRNSNLRKKSLNIFFQWFVISGTYYGLSWNTSNLGGNDYLNFFIAGAVEFPANIILLCTLNRWGRKTLMCGTMLLAGAALLLTLFVPYNMTWLIITFAMIGKLGITAAYGTLYIFSAEQFPTVIRNVALGASSTCARVGGILAPYVNLLAEYWQPLPLLIFGALSLAAGVTALLLPETMNQKLPDTIAEGENFGKVTDDKQDINGDVLLETKESEK
ncbi:organic cation transporter protein-like [Schistocerca piceifrons]|uniref:organic cation transporter protein-like n=1 Tax=Schistocerca piceifrons TaxID=274613 RepID=UPI001F5E4DB4|nr:organic cation transporter protein-like [Schistocerca piceifrons]XP_047110118.1 organic cation transporter protein-like [Schistocerca piceifrons]XP_047110119.1 organic cation transporter protein-like [Schistocerca piceifrons]